MNWAPASTALGEAPSYKGRILCKTIPRLIAIVIVLAIVVLPYASISRSFALHEQFIL